MTQEPNNPFLNLRVRNLLLWGLLFSLMFGFVLGAIAQSFNLNLDDPVWILITYILLFVSLSLWLIVQFKRQRVSLRWVTGRIPNHPKWLSTAGLVIATLLFSLSSFQLAFYVISFAAPSFVESLLQELSAQANPQTAAPLLYEPLSVIASVIVAPLSEELIFRGFILQRWAVKWNLPLALIVSSLVFGLLHPNPIGLTVFGLVMGLLYVKTRSLMVPILCHALNNVLAKAMEFLPIDSGSTEIPNLEQFRSEVGIGILLMVVSAPWLIQFITKNFPRQDATIPYLINVLSASARRSV
ncbi:MAG: CPBP family intramembrane metalloprotease [Leptolyngbyaceae cyanobacterium RU_5_1]|nr:CPBP family intramembrane metalloprotease [Leptolyngbyaceae cyanobacterium RU_5_1]